MTCHSISSLRTVAFALTLGWLGAGCVSQPQSSRLQVEDFQDMAGAMSTSLSRAFAERGPSDEPWIVSIQRVTNLSGDVLTEGEQWYPMGKLVSSRSMQRLWDEHRVKVVIPAERAELLRVQSPGVLDGHLGEGQSPTHVVSATLRSVTRGGFDARTDLYSAEFEMTERASGTPVWNDRFELKRQALGVIWD
ncbi:MAG: hypothetical protein AAF797_09430 [Planctomycetota bacterium]